MTIRRISFVKLIVGLAIIIGALILGVIIWVVVSTTISSWREKQSIDAAVKDIKLPAQYKLVGSTYDNQHCLDVCAHTVLKFQSTDGSDLSEDTVVSELKNLGYTFDGYYYSKNYKNKKVHITQTNFPLTQLTLDVSL